MKREEGRRGPEPGGAAGPYRDAAGVGRGAVGRLGAAASDAARGAVGAVRWPDHRIEKVQRRTLGTLVAAQAFGGLGITIGIAVAAILAEQILGSPELAGLGPSVAPAAD